MCFILNSVFLLVNIGFPKMLILLPSFQVVGTLP